MSRKVKYERVRQHNINWDSAFDLNPSLDTQIRMVRLLHVPPRSYPRKPVRLELNVTLDETKRRGVSEMRCVFQTELKIDIDTTDDALRKAFIDLVLLKAREVYGVAGMLAKGQPVVTCSVIDRNGREKLPLFDQPVRDETDDDSGE